MAKIIKLTDNDNTTLFPVSDARAIQVKFEGHDAKSLHDVIEEDELVWAESYNELNDRLTALEPGHEPGSDNQAISLSNYDGNTRSTTLTLSDNGGSVTIEQGSGISFTYTQGNNFTISSTVNDRQGLSGEYRAAPKTAYVKLSSGGEVGIYDKGTVSAGVAAIELSYTSTSTDRRGIGLKITYRDSDTHHTHQLVGVASTTNPGIKLQGSSVVGQVNFKGDGRTTVSYEAGGNVLVSTPSQALSGEYRSEPKTAYVKLSDGKEIGIYDKGGKAAAGNDIAFIELSYTSTATDRRGIGLKVTYNGQYVLQSSTTTSAGYPVLFKNSANNTAELAGVRFDSDATTNFHYNPSTNLLTATNINAPTSLKRASKNVITVTGEWNNTGKIVVTDGSYLAKPSTKALSDLDKYIEYGTDTDETVSLLAYSPDYRTAKKWDQLQIDNAVNPYRITSGNSNAPASIDMAYMLYTVNTGTSYQYITKYTDDGALRWSNIDAAYVYITYAGVTDNVANVILENEEITAAALNELNSRIESIHQVTAYSNLSSGTLLSYVKVDDQNVNTYVPVASTSVAGIVQLGTGASNAAQGNHNHTVTYNGTDAYIVTSTNATNYAEIKRATNLKGGAANKIPYQTAANTTSFLAAPTANNQVLKYDSRTGIYWGTATDTDNAFIVANSATATQVNNTSNGNGAWLNVWSNQTAANTTVANKHSVKVYGTGPVTVSLPSAGNMKIELTTYLTFDVVNANMTALSLL